MKQVLVVSVMSAMIAALVAGCGGGSSCEDAIDNALKKMGMGGSTYGKMRAEGIKVCQSEKWSAKKRACIASAGSMGAMEKCDEVDKAGDSGGGRAKKSEAELNLDKLQKELKMYYAENASLPMDTTQLTPPQACCEAPDHKCPGNEPDWRSSSLWQKLDFEVTDPHYFQYAYSSDDGKTATVRAVGDLDCDGTTVTYKMTIDTSTGTPTAMFEKPSNPD